MRALPSFLLWLLVTSLARGASIISQPQINLTAPLTNVIPIISHNRIRFIDAVYSAVLYITRRYPRAAFIEVQATTDSDPTNNPLFMTDVRVMFSIPDREPYKSLFIEMSENWGHWQQPRLSTIIASPREDILPARLGMDIITADQLMKDAGYRQNYWAVIVCLPKELPASREQVTYIFEMEDGEGIPDNVTVGTRDRMVTATFHDNKANEWLDGGEILTA